MTYDFPDGLDRTERSVCKALAYIDKNWQRYPETDGGWTRAIKDAVGAIGKGLGYRVYAASSKFERNGEWSLTWVGLRCVETSSLICLSLSNQSGTPRVRWTTSRSCLCLVLVIA
jgi:hypothetical protein